MPQIIRRLLRKIDRFINPHLYIELNEMKTLELQETRLTISDKMKFTLNLDLIPNVRDQDILVITGIRYSLLGYITNRKE
jgi:hypothetical protein